MLLVAADVIRLAHPAIEESNECLWLFWERLQKLTEALRGFVVCRGQAQRRSKLSYVYYLLWGFQRLK